MSKQGRGARGAAGRDESALSGVLSGRMDGLIAWQSGKGVLAGLCVKMWGGGGNLPPFFSVGHEGMRMRMISGRGD